MVTPFTPTDWKMTFDGETVSLRPSIGSWTLKCRSHYVIDCGRVIEAGPWSEDQIAAERKRDREAKARFYDHELAEEPAGPAIVGQASSGWKRIWRRVSRRG